MPVIYKVEDKWTPLLESIESGVYIKYINTIYNHEVVGVITEIYKECFHVKTFSINWWRHNDMRTFTWAVSREAVNLSEMCDFEVGNAP